MATKSLQPQPDDETWELDDIITAELIAAIVGHLSTYFTRFLDQVFDDDRARTAELTPDQFARWLRQRIADALLSNDKGPGWMIEQAVTDACRRYQLACELADAEDRLHKPNP